MTVTPDDLELDAPQNQMDQFIAHKTIQILKQVIWTEINLYQNDGKRNAWRRT